MARKVDLMREELETMRDQGVIMQCADHEKLTGMMVALQDELLENAPAIPCTCLDGCHICKNKRWISARDLKDLTNTPEYKSAEASRKQAQARLAEERRLYGSVSTRPAERTPSALERKQLKLLRVLKRATELHLLVTSMSKSGRWVKPAREKSSS
jgi:hypothetical protein